MGENSNIAWTTHTFNPWVGCQRVSPGCTHCYAESYDRRVGGVPKKQRADPEVAETRWGPHGRRTRTTVSNWRQPLKWDAAAKAAGVRHRVFCSSLADVFEDRPELVPWRLELLELIRTTPNLDWLLLTKRPENVKRLISYGIDSTVTTRSTGAISDWLQACWLHAWMNGEPPTNVWMGTTVEDQQRANERIPALLKVPARVRFLSCEPLLERVDLMYPTALFPDGPDYCCDGRECGCYGRPIDPPLLYGIDWVIVGGESGPGARPFALEWARDLVGQCRQWRAAPFVKQLGARPVSDLDADLCGRIGARHELRTPQPSVFNVDLRDSSGGDPAEWPADLRVREFPKVTR